MRTGGGAKLQVFRREPLASFPEVRRCCRPPGLLCDVVVTSGFGREHWAEKFQGRNMNHRWMTGVR